MMTVQWGSESFSIQEPEALRRLVRRVCAVSLGYVAMSSVPELVDLLQIHGATVQGRIPYRLERVAS